MPSNNDALKKHHFWILAGIAPVLVLLAIVFLMTGVSGAIDKANAEVDAAQKEVKQGNPPGQGAIAAIEKQKGVLGNTRGELWKLNWDKQAGFFTWPESPSVQFSKYNTMKFGTQFRDFIASPNYTEVFKPAYAAAYEQLGASVAPTTMKDGWRKVLRYVGSWGARAPESRQLWLAMEDLWVQRALLQPIAAVNQTIARFDLVRDGLPAGTNPPPLARKFRSRVWELDLKVEPRDQAAGGGQVLKGKLKNRTGQLQVIGVGSAMVVRVWFDPKMDLPPFDFRIEGSGVPGGEAIDVPPLPVHVIPAGVNVVEIAKVEQVLDRRTVPIRRLDRLALGYPSSKDYAKPLLPPTFWPDATTDATAAPAGGGPGAPPPGSGMQVGPGGGPLGSGDLATGGAGPGGAVAGGMGRAGGLPLLAVADGNRKRYVEINDQLRRVPVAMTLIVDQMYVNDVLVAYANSALRFETSQVHWSRFTEPLGDGPGGSDGGGSAGGNGDDAVAAAATLGAGLSSGSYGSVGPPPGYPTAGASSYGPPGPPGGSGDPMSSISDAQANSGLVQLTVYGLVTLYERHDPTKKEGEPAAPTPAAVTPTPDPAKPATPPTTDPAKPVTPAADPAKPMTPAETPKPMGTPPTPAAPTPPAPTDKKPDATPTPAAPPTTPPAPKP